MLQLKNAAPDVVIFVSYTSDSILFMKTMHTLNWKPPILIGDDSGFSDNAFIEAVGDLAQGVFNRSSYDIGKPGARSLRRQRAVSRSTPATRWTTPRPAAMQGFLALMEAINRAGIDRTGEDPGGSGQPGPEAGATDDRLQRHQIRRQGPEHAGRDAAGAALRQEICRRLAGQISRAASRPAVQGLGLDRHAVFLAQHRGLILCLQEEITGDTSERSRRHAYNRILRFDISLIRSGHIIADWRDKMANKLTACTVALLCVVSLPALAGPAITNQSAGTYIP